MISAHGDSLVNEPGDRWEVRIVKPDGSQIIKNLGLEVLSDNEIAFPVSALDFDRRGEYAYQVNIKDSAYKNFLFSRIQGSASPGSLKNSALRNNRATLCFMTTRFIKSAFPINLADKLLESRPSAETPPIEFAEPTLRFIVTEFGTSLCLNKVSECSIRHGFGHTDSRRISALKKARRK
jgi:hypothetical protein